MTGKKLFLESCLINLLATTVAAATLAASQSQIQGLSVIARMMVGVIGLIYVITTTYATTLCWSIDTGGLTARMAHAANNISFAAHQCPFIGLLGSVAGIFIFMSSSLTAGSDTEQLKQISMIGIGVAFVPTIAGVFAQIILSWQHHIILQEIEEPKGAELENGRSLRHEEA